MMLIRRLLDPLYAAAAVMAAICLVGILLVILCGIYTGRRERRKAQATPLGRPGPP